MFISFAGFLREGEVNEPFSSFANGLNAVKVKDFSESMDESLRHFAEECNNIQVSP